MLIGLILKACLMLLGLVLCLSCLRKIKKQLVKGQ